MASLEEQRAALQYPNTEFNIFGKVMGGLTTAGAGYVAVDSLIKSNKAKKEAKRQQGYVDTLMSQYMSKPIYNPYQNLSVATQAAEIKQQETDQALANTLDTIRELGYGAGGATALARAAQKSKLGIAADIEKQEVANEQLKGKGEMIVQQAEFARLGQQMDYEQSKADQARAEQFGYAERGMDAIAGLGSIGLAMGRGLAKPKSQSQAQDNKDNTIQDPNTDFYGRINNPDPSLGLNIQKPDLLPDNKIANPSTGLTIDPTSYAPDDNLTGGSAASNTFVPRYKRLDIDDYINPQGATEYERLGLSGLVKDREILRSLGMPTDDIQKLINQQSALLGK